MPVDKRSSAVVPSPEFVQGMCLVRNQLTSDAAIDVLCASGLLPDTVQKHNTSTTKRVVGTWLRAFQANNFAISSELMVPKGAGVYTIGSLLNHSCCPNCILTYDLRTKIQVRWSFTKATAHVAAL